MTLCGGMRAVVECAGGIGGGNGRNVHGIGTLIDIKLGSVLIDMRVGSVEVQA